MLALTPTHRQNEDRHIETGMKHDSSSYINMIQASIISATAWAWLLVMLDNKGSDPYVCVSLFLSVQDSPKHFLILSDVIWPLPTAKSLLVNSLVILISENWNLVF